MAVYNKIYTKEKWEQVNKFNKNLLDDYIMQITTEGKSKGTISQYKNDARIIMIYILEELDNKPMYKLTRKHFRNFILYLQDNGLSSARINRMLSTSRNLINFGLEDEEFEEDFEDMKLRPDRIKGLQKEKRREIIFLTDEEVHIIFNTLVEKKKYQQALLCALMYDSGGRRNECYQVEKDSITQDGNFTNQVIGKRGKKFRLMYNDLTKKAHKLYMESRTDDCPALWITRSEGQVVPSSYETLYNQIVSWRKILEKETGEYKEFNPHSFRHSTLNELEKGTHYIARKLGKKFDISELQKLANHSDLSTTASYLEDRSEDMLLEAFGIA